jgi:membrane associated rhomboid family serine protease
MNDDGGPENHPPDSRPTARFSPPVPRPHPDRLLWIFCLGMLLLALVALAGRDLSTALVGFICSVITAGYLFVRQRRDKSNRPGYRG